MHRFQHVVVVCSNDHSWLAVPSSGGATEQAWNTCRRRLWRHLIAISVANCFTTGLRLIRGLYWLTAMVLFVLLLKGWFLWCTHYKLLACFGNVVGLHPGIVQSARADPWCDPQLQEARKTRCVLCLALLTVMQCVVTLQNFSCIDFGAFSWCMCRQLDSWHLFIKYIDR